MVCDFDGTNGGWNSSTFVVEERKKHFFVKLSGVGKFGMTEDTGNVVIVRIVLEVKLGGNSFDDSSVGAGRSGYHPPPFIRRLTAGERDEVSGMILVVLWLFYCGVVG